MFAIGSVLERGANMRSNGAIYSNINDIDQKELGNVTPSNCQTVRIVKRISSKTVALSEENISSKAQQIGKDSLD